jgi:hypothetical protein
VSVFTRTATRLVVVLEVGGDRQDLLVDELVDGPEDVLLDLGVVVGGAEAPHGGNSPSVEGTEGSGDSARPRPGRRPEEAGLLTS